MTIHVMLDLETWGKKPGCDLRSIGATVFDPLTGKVGKECRACNGGRDPGNVNDGGDCSDCLNTRTDHAGEFYIATDNPQIAQQPWHIGANQQRIEPQPRPKYPLTRDPGTVQWWNDQSAEAQSAFADPLDLRVALNDFGDWLRGVVADCYYPTEDWRVPDDVALWSHGPAFDVAILAAAYDACRLPLPWHYRAPRDTRTAFDMAGQHDHSAFMQQFNHGTAHNALDDAISQARCVCAAYRIVRRWRNTSYADDGLCSAMNNIVTDIADEGDRAYFGSTNDADRLREIAEDLDADRFEKEAFPDQPTQRVEQWNREYLASNGHHWGNKINWQTAAEIARRLEC